MDAQAAEAKQQKKTEKQEKRKNEEHEPPVFGVTSLGATKTQPLKVKSKVPETDDLEDDVPLLLDPDLINLKSTLETADVVLQVLDARDPLSYRSSGVEEFLKEGKKIRTFLVLNKIGASPGLLCIRCLYSTA